MNMSSCGLLIASEEALVCAGARLQLVVSCRVTRCLPDEFAVKLEQYQFKTKKR